MKIVINDDYGGFGLSDAGITHYAKLKGIDLIRRDGKFIFSNIYDYYLPDNKTRFYDGDIDRTDPALVQTVEELGSAADGFCSSLKVIEIPDGTDWVVQEYDGREWIAERHETWS